MWGGGRKKNEQQQIQAAHAHLLLPTNKAEVTGPSLVSPPGLFVRLRVNQKLMTDGVRLDLRKKVTDGVQPTVRDRNYATSSAGTLSTSKRSLILHL